MPLIMIMTASMCLNPVTILTLSFTTDESVDKQSLHSDLMIGSVDRSSDVNLSETGNQDGKSWVAFYTVKDGDNGTFQWNFHGIDRAGNALEKDTGLDQISALAFSDFSASPSETFGYPRIRELRS